MEQQKKRIEVICEYSNFLEKTITWYNRVYKKDFEIVGYLQQEVNFAIIEYVKATTEDVFELACIYGRYAEDFDKKISTPPGSSFIG